VRVSQVAVDGGRAHAVLVSSECEPLRTSEIPSVAPTLLALMPALGRHRCRSGRGVTFEAEIDDTESAHLVEHIALELMALAGSPRTLVGDTSWDWHREPRGTFHVRLDCDVPDACLIALDLATDIVTSLLAGEEPGDVGEMVDRLVGLRESGGP
jgi:hypothetical protein